MEYMKGCKDNQFDLAIVDPPYGIGASEMTMGSGKHKFTKGKRWDSQLPNGEYFDELFRVSNNQIIWGGNYFSAYLKPTPHWAVWDKLNPNLSFAEGELAWINKGKNLRIFKHYSAIADTYGGKIHPTSKPVKLYEWLLQNYAKEGQTILDTHLGSGSIAIACDKMGFDLVGCEIDEDYYNGAMKRLKEHQSQMRLF